jgi:hypothetical protein
VASIGRIGLHHQPTQILVTFDGPVDPTKAADPSNYTVITSTGKRIPITSATFDPSSNTVTLRPAVHLNVHYRFRLELVLPCPNEVTGETVVVPFGGKQSLVGFENHHGQFVSVRNARIVGITDQNGQFIPIHGHRLTGASSAGSSRPGNRLGAAPRSRA